MNPDSVGVEWGAAARSATAHGDHRDNAVVACINELERLLDEFASHLPKLPINLPCTVKADVGGVVGKFGEVECSHLRALTS